MYWSFFWAGIILLLFLFALIKSGLISISLFNPSTSTFILWFMVILWLTLIFVSFYPDILLPIDFRGNKEAFQIKYEYRMVLIILLSGFGLLIGLSLTQFKYLLIPHTGKSCQKRWSTWYRSPIYTNGHTTRLFSKIFWFLTFLSLLLYISYIIEIGITKLPFIMLISGSDYLSIIQSREESFKLLDSPFLYFYHLLRFLIFPILINFSFITARLINRKIDWFIFIIITFVGISYNALSTALSPIAELIVQLFLCEIIIQGGNKFKQIKLYIMSVFFVIFFVLLFLSLYPDSNISYFSNLSKLLGELIVLRGIDLVQNIAVFSNVYPLDNYFFLGFEGIYRISNLLDLNSHNINNHLYLYIYPNSVIRTGSYNGPWFLYDYALFSYPFVFLGSILLGVLLSSIGNYFRKMPKDIFLITCFVYTISCSRYILDSQLSNWLISKGGISAVLFYFLIQHVAKINKKQIDSAPKI